MAETAEAEARTPQRAGQPGNRVSKPEKAELARRAQRSRSGSNRAQARPQAPQTDLARFCGAWRPSAGPAGTPQRTTPTLGGAPRGPSGRRRPGLMEAHRHAETAAIRRRANAQGKSPAAVRSGARCPQLAWSLVPLFTGKGTEDCCPNLRTLQRPWIGTSNPCYWPNEPLIKLAGLAKGLRVALYAGPSQPGCGPLWSQFTSGLLRRLVPHDTPPTLRRSESPAGSRPVHADHAELPPSRRPGHPSEPHHHGLLFESMDLLADGTELRLSSFFCLADAELRL